MSRKILYFVLVVVAVVGIGGYILWAFWAGVPSDYVRAEKEDFLETVLATGKVAGRDVATLSFQATGVVDEVRVEEGERVFKGDILAVLENNEEENRVAQQVNAVKQAESRKEELQTTELKQAEENLKKAKAREKIAEATYNYTARTGETEPKEMLRQAEIEFELAQDRYERSKELFDNEAISLSELEEAENEMKKAESNLKVQQNVYEGSHLNIEQAKSDLETARSDVSQAQSTLNSLRGEALEQANLEKERAQLMLEEAEILYENTYLKAPSSGQINRLNVSPGESVQRGQDVITFFPAGEVSYVEVQVDEEYTGSIVPGQEAVITSTAFPDKEFNAAVSHVSPGIDEDRGPFKVRLALERLVEDFVPDLAVFAEIIIGEWEKSIVLEQRCVYIEDGKSFVYKEQDGRVSRQQVETEEVGNGYVLVSEGLEPGDIVLTSLDLTEGQRVSLAEEE